MCKDVVLNKHGGFHPQKKRHSFHPASWRRFPEKKFTFSSSTEKFIQVFKNSLSKSLVEIEIILMNDLSVKMHTNSHIHVVICFTAPIAILMPNIIPSSTITFLVSKYNNNNWSYSGNEKKCKNIVGSQDTKCGTILLTTPNVVQCSHDYQT